MKKAFPLGKALVREWCPGGDSNPHGLPRYHLKVVRLPIPPPGQFLEESNYLVTAFAVAPVAPALVGAVVAWPGVFGAVLAKGATFLIRLVVLRPPR